MKTIIKYLNNTINKNNPKNVIHIETLIKSNMSKIFNDDPKHLHIKMSNDEFVSLKRRAYSKLKTVSQFIREELCQ